MNNSIEISGIITSDKNYSHEYYGEKFYNVQMISTRDSGCEDEITLLLSDRLLNSDIKIGDYVYVNGEIRTYNNDGHLIVSVFVNNIDILDICPNEVIDENIVNMNGYICKKSNIRSTPLGRIICDIILAVNRPYGKSDYIPCICWGRNANYVDSLNVGDNIIISGRFQSRKYTKNEEEKTVYEVSVQSVELNN